jgi:radical SAM protein with 4Fe4S-binding SPASM domain
VHVPDNIIVSTPPGFLEQHDCRVILRLFACDDPRAVAARYNKRVLHIDIDAKTLAKQTNLGLLADHRVRIFVEDDDFPLIHHIAKNAVKHQLVLMVKPDQKVKRRINLLSEFSIPIHIDPSVPVERPEVLQEILNYYLRSPALSTPIAPFNAIMKHEIEGKGASLWDTEYERPGRYLYVAETGAITQSRRFVENGIVFGNMDAEWDDIVRSDPYTRLMRYKADLFKQAEACAYCDGFNVCIGYFKAIDNSAPCEHWQAVFEAIRQTVKETKDLIRDRYGKPA